MVSCSTYGCEQAPEQSLPSKSYGISRKWRKEDYPSGVGRNPSFTWRKHLESLKEEEPYLIDGNAHSNSEGSGKDDSWRRGVVASTIQSFTKFSPHTCTCRCLGSNDYHYYSVSPWESLVSTFKIGNTGRACCSTWKTNKKPRPPSFSGPAMVFLWFGKYLGSAASVTIGCLLSLPHIYQTLWTIGNQYHCVQLQATTTEVNWASKSKH